MELNKAVEILMHNHRFKLGKADAPYYTPETLNVARNVLNNDNETQRRLNNIQNNLKKS